MKHIVEYTLPYEHHVLVGIETDTPENAIATAEALFNEGTIWQDTTEVPLLFDDFEEDGDAGVPLEFKVVQTLGPDEPWPKGDASVQELRRRAEALHAAHLLVEAYRRGEESGGSIDWADLDRAHEAALRAVNETS